MKPRPALLLAILLPASGPGFANAQTSVATRHAFDSSATAADPTVPDLLENSSLVIGLTYTNSSDTIQFRGTAMDFSFATLDTLTWTVTARSGYYIDSLDEINISGNFLNMPSGSDTVMGGVFAASLDGGSSWTNMQTISHTGTGGGATLFSKNNVDLSFLNNVGTQPIMLRLNLRDNLGDGAANSVTWGLTNMTLQWTASAVPEPSAPALLMLAAGFTALTRRRGRRRRP